MQQMFLGLGAIATKTYVDDVFSTFVDSGTGNARTIVNNIDIADKGGLVWQKWRSGNASANDNNSSHILADTVRGTSKYLKANTSDSEFSVSAVGSFNSNGYQTGGNLTSTDNSGDKYVSFTFARQKGFFDVVTYTGNGTTTGRAINHSLGSKPGFILVKRLNSGGSNAYQNWFGYHDALEDGYRLKFNTTDQQQSDGNSVWGTGSSFVRPSSTQFTVGEFINFSGADYVAYVFAGGESTAATARSVDFQSESIASTLTIPDSSDLNVSTGNFTIEGWFYVRAENKTFFSTGGGQTTSNQAAVYMYDDEWSIRLTMRDSSGNLVQNAYNIGATPRGQWFHLAISRDSNTYRVFINGTQAHTFTSSATLNDPSNYTFNIGSWNNGSQGHLQGKISNFRLVKGTAVYTSSFKVPTEPLTNITNTKLLCCNNSSVTGATVTPATITAVGNATADTDSPFDDPAGFVFGEEGESVIKCGSYVGNGNNDGPEINLGFEPQWLMVKRTDSADEWPIYDSMRGIVTGGNDARLYANQSAAEYTSGDYFDLTPTGFKVTKSSGEVNSNGGTYIYLCIRRPDGYVGKPVELGTAVLSLTYGSNDTNPSYVTNFPVDWAFSRRPASTEDWYTAARLIQGKYLKLNDTDTETSHSAQMFDYSNGWHTQTANLTDYFSWSWKRHAGFDVACWSGTNSVVERRHGLGKTPEMIIFKCRSSGRHWRAYHKGLNGGTNPEDYVIRLNGAYAEGSNTNYMNGTAPTSTHFVSGNDDDTNGSGKTYIALLFASVPTISAVGYYDGDATNNINLTSQLDFTPRFFMCKSTTADTGWLVVDKTRDNNMGKRLFIDSTAAETSYDAVFAMSKYLEPNKTGLSVGGEKYLFYAHA